ncbi:hypothetical protein SK128_012024 [Halocaridina rubra]|uniref:Uncharacterized protein n=1 Tax=Halocaridina rubra TaxID=373956 RepID=A0AAN8ZYC4_HALRR
MTVLQNIREFSQDTTASVKTGHQHMSPTKQVVDIDDKVSLKKSDTKGNSVEDLTIRHLDCSKCLKSYDLDSRLPYFLCCEHSVCRHCLMEMTVSESPVCTICKISTNAKSVEESQVNHILRDEIKKRLECKQSKLPTLSKQPSTNTLQKSEIPYSSSKQNYDHNVNLNSSQGKVTQNRYNDKQPNPWNSGKHHDHVEKEMHNPPHIGAKRKAPHESSCLSSGVNPKFYCALCQKWVFNDCAMIEHQRNECNLIEKRDALWEMSGAHVKGARATVETIDNTLREMEVLNVQLEALSLTMQAACKYIEKEKDRVHNMMKNGLATQTQITDAINDLVNKENLPDSLAGLKELEDFSKKGHHWKKTSETFDLTRVYSTTKEILLYSVQVKKLSGIDMTPVLLLDSQMMSEKVLFSHMAIEGRRIFVHSLEAMDDIPQGTPAIPLKSIKACLEPSSSLAFLDIGLKDRHLCRLLVRLVGETQRGRQFLMMCTGEAGPSYRGTRFHRIWNKGLPGESIWGGDYEKGDGSGGASVLKLSQEDMYKLPVARLLPIRAGLVVGSYEIENPGTLFRIYTKNEAVDGKESYSSQNASPYSSYSKEDKVTDASAFGLVEFGLDDFVSGIRDIYVSDLVILSCGVVIET